MDYLLVRRDNFILAVVVALGVFLAGSPGVVHGENLVSWYENDGSNTNFEHHEISELFGAHSITPVDFNGDGDTDVVAASGDTYLWFENDGIQPTFSSHIIDTVPHSDTIWEIAPVDLNRDGDYDLVAIESDTLAWYENTGNDEDFTRHVIESGTPVKSGSGLTVLPLSSDTLPDVVHASWADTLSWFENTGSDTIFNRHVIDTGLSVANILDVKGADFGSDSDQDLVVSNFSDTIAWYENVGSDTEFPRRLIDTGTMVIEPQNVEVADFEPDGDLDVAVNSFSDTLAWYEQNDSDSGFTGRIIDNSDDAKFSDDLELVDFDDDGNMDVVTAHSFGGYAWYQNTGSDIDFNRITVDSVDSRTDSADDVEVTDIDKDGDFDLITASNNVIRRTSNTEENSCLIGRNVYHPRVISLLRELRDGLLRTRVGRLIVPAYYTL